MRERIGGLIGPEISRYLWMGTFHSIFARILRVEAASIGYTSNYTIYDTQDSRNLIKTIIKEKNLDDKLYKPAEIHSRISSAKNNLITAASYNANSQIMARDQAAKKPFTGEIFSLYEVRCKKADAMDFDDLLVNTNILFKNHPEVLQKYREKFDYVLVDEYQDTNYSQYLIVKKLVEKHHNLCVVGDDAQSIYSFRGAKIENILNFKNDYPEYELFKLEQNYRSTQNIVNAANSIIDKNKGQIKKTVFSENETGEKIKVIKALTDNEEGYLVISSIIDIKNNEQAHDGDFVILYRTNMQSRIFEEALRKRNIPYKIYGGLSFYQRKEIKDLLAYLRLISNNNDDEGLKRIINYPLRGIGDSTVDKISAYSNMVNKSLWAVITSEDILQAGLNQGTMRKLQEFVLMIRGFIEKSNTLNAFELATEVASATGILKELHNDRTPEGVSRYENIQELLNGIQEFTLNSIEEGKDYKIANYLQEISLVTDMDKDKSEDRDKVTLMTIHSAKGLEFKYVFIVGVEENLFPSHMTLASPSEIEEERRLFYVAVTRAEKRVTLSFAGSRFKWGELTICSPSRFLKEIHEDFLDNIVDDEMPAMDDSDDFFETKIFKPIKKAAPVKSSPSFIPPSHKIPMRSAASAQPVATDFDAAEPEMIQMGMVVEHQRFGRGKVINIEGTAPNIKATVFFTNAGSKQLLLKFARLRIIG